MLLNLPEEQSKDLTPQTLCPWFGLEILEVDCDFSFRFSYFSSCMFQSLQQMSKYCLEQGIPFPKIELTEEDKENPKECYVFEDTGNPDAPVVLHFPLVNDTFKEFKHPGEYLTFAKLSV